MMSLGKAEDLRKMVDRWRMEIVRGRNDRSTASSLRDRIWQPIAQQLNGQTLILISPDGPISRLPIAALPDAESDRYLIESYQL